MWTMIFEGIVFAGVLVILSVAMGLSAELNGILIESYSR